jgi:prepilin-type processing-associated H-X9-DG protein
MDVPDGTPNTILVATARTPVPWTSPQDMTFDPDGVLPAMNDQFRSGFNVVMADGSVRLIPLNVPLATLQAMITRNGNEVVPLP